MQICCNFTSNWGFTHNVTKISKLVFIQIFESFCTYRRACILGHLGIFLIWSSFVSCLLFLLFYVSLCNLCSSTCRKIPNLWNLGIGTHGNYNLRLTVLLLTNRNAVFTLLIICIISAKIMLLTTIQILEFSIIIVIYTKGSNNNITQNLTTKMNLYSVEVLLLCIFCLSYHSLNSNL